MTAFQGSFFLFPSYTHECSRKSVLCSCIQPGVSFGHGVFGIRKRAARAKVSGRARANRTMHRDHVTSTSRIESNQVKRALGRFFLCCGCFIFSTYLSLCDVFWA